MKKRRKITQVELPVPELADLTSRAAAAGVPTAYYIGIAALTGAYGALHPDVVEFRMRANQGQSGTETQPGADGGTKGVL